MSQFLQYDYSTLKPNITKAVLELIGRRLAIQGDIRLKIGLAPTLAVAEAALQNAAWGRRPQMATVKRLEVEVGLLPLLQGTILYTVFSRLLQHSDEQLGDAAIRCLVGGRLHQEWSG